MKILVAIMTLLVSFGAAAKTTVYECVDQQRGRQGSIVIKDPFVGQSSVSFFLEDQEMMKRKFDQLRESNTPEFPDHAMMYESIELILVHSTSYVYIPRDFFNEAPAAGGDVTYISQGDNLVGNSGSKFSFNFSCVLR